MPVGKAARTRVRLQVSVLTSIFWLVLGMFAMVAIEGTTQSHTVLRSVSACAFAFALGKTLTAHSLRCVVVARRSPYRTGWTYIDAFYFCVITLTTVGLGDFVPETGPGIKFAYFYCMVSAMWLPRRTHGWLGWFRSD